MEFTIKYSQVPRSKSLEDLLKIKAEKLLDRFQIKGRVLWALGLEHHHYTSDLHLKFMGNEFHVQSKSENLFQTFGPNITKLELLLERHFSRERELSCMAF